MPCGVHFQSGRSQKKSICNVTHTYLLIRSSYLFNSSFLNCLHAIMVLLIFIVTLVKVSCEYRVGFGRFNYFKAFAVELGCSLRLDFTYDFI